LVNDDWLTQIVAEARKQPRRITLQRQKRRPSNEEGDLS
jgi:hypothetical protein